MSTCHSYDIYYKFRYSCSGCGQTFGRHTKSIDLTRQCCARCKGRLRLLGAFDRFFEHVQRAKPGLSAREAAAEALDKVYGADINPFAVAIAKFRLTLSFLGKAAFDKISAAPKLPLHVAVADSLLYNPQHEQGALFHQSDARVVDWDRKVFALEEEAQARQVLHRRCAAVVGNPPYITPKDRVLRDRYRELYVSASGKYALSAPFCERFFHLARPGGLVGQITANSFMKREFGKSLIESFLSTVNLELLVSTAGAYIPGHGTPTLMMFGSNEPPRSATVRLVLSEGGEPAEPVDPSRGLVWSSIVEHWSSPGYVDEFVSVADCDRELLAAHPWSLSGGGALELKAHIEAEARESLGDLATAIGFDAIMGEDDLYYGPPDWLARLGVPPKYTRMLGIGENVRNWNIRHSASVLFPYDDFLEPALPEHEPTRRHFWRYKTVLERRRQFGKTTLEAGLEWFEYRSFYKSKRSVPTSIAYAFVSSRNHFVVDRGQRVFNQSAPVIKLPPGCSEDQYAALSCFLNSSISCFWMKQVSYPMGGDQMGDGGRLSATTWADRYQFAGRALLPMPLPEGWEVLANLGSALLQAAECRDAATPARVAERWFAGELDGPLAEVLNTARQDEAAAFSELVRLQECVDWTCYRLFGLCDDGLAPGPSADDIAGRRTFEHLLWQRTMGEGPDATWFERTGASPPDGVRPGRLQAQRIAAIGGSDLLAAVERPDFKRWWRATDYDAEIAAALRLVLEQAAEAELAGEQSLVLSESDVERRLREDSRVVELLELAEQFGGLQIAEVLATQAAPFLAAHRYTGKGLEKRREWEALWRSQAEGRSATPRTPKYSPKDMRSGSTWRLRGKLDVPRERFVSYPGCESDEDRKAAYCWAGLDHQQRAKALATLYYDRKTNEGWERDRLTPMLAGLLELQFWLELWHDKPSEDYGGVSPAEYYRSFVDGECQALGLTHDDLKAWRPPEKTKRGRKKSSKKSKKADQ